MDRSGYSIGEEVNGLLSVDVMEVQRAGGTKKVSTPSLLNARTLDLHMQ